MIQKKQRETHGLRSAVLLVGFFSLLGPKAQCQEEVVRRDFVGAGEVVVASVTSGPSQLSVWVNDQQGAWPKVAPLPYMGARSICRVEAGSDVGYLVSGWDSGQGVGYVVYVPFDGSVVGPSMTVWSGPDPVDASVYSGDGGGVYALCGDDSLIVWGVFDPASPSPFLTTSSHSVGLGLFDQPEWLSLNLGKVGGLEFLLISSDDPLEPGLKVGVAGGVFGQSSVTEQLLAFGVKGTGDLSSGQVKIVGMPGLDYVVVDSVSGASVAGATMPASGVVSVAATGLTVGMRLVAYRVTDGVYSDTTLEVYESEGIAESSSLGFQIEPFGSTEAATIAVGESRFAMMFHGMSSSKADSVVEYDAFAVVGLREDVQHDALSGRYFLQGASVGYLPVKLTHLGYRVIGHGDLPIPDDPLLSGSPLALQWVVDNKDGTVSLSNVAHLVIQPGDAALRMQMSRSPSRQRMGSGGASARSNLSQIVSEGGLRVGFSINR